jgi:uncharacterized protein YdeI (YjbR/CyaY-like superfamily)
MKRAETVDEYIGSAADWKGALARLRKILNSTELEETVKWGAPCYTIDGKNVVGVGAYKAYCGLWFFQGALLADKRNLLINAQDGKTKALRQWRFQSTSEIDARLIKAYVKEAIDVQRKGLAIKPERGKRVELPPELAGALRADKKTRAARVREPYRRRETRGDQALTPGEGPPDDSRAQGPARQVPQLLAARPGLQFLQ